MRRQKSKEDIHDQVAKTYARALERARSGRGGCCGPESAGQSSASVTGVAARTAGYAEELARVPAGAASASFGCGNPVAFAGVRPGDTVLDLGSGAGLDLILAARKVGAEGRVIGVDMTDEMIAAARRNIAGAGLTNVEVRKGLIEALPVDDRSVDWVISNCVINLSPDKTAVFREIARVLKPGGRFSISDLVADDLPAELREDPAVYGSCIGGAIAEAEYVAGLEAAGLSDVRVRDRLVYDAATLKGIVASDLGDLGIDASDVDASNVDSKIARIAGRVQSVRLEGTRSV